MLKTKHKSISIHMLNEHRLYAIPPVSRFEDLEALRDCCIGGTSGKDGVP